MKVSMSDWAKREVEIACKRENPDRKDGEFDYGCGCYESALKAYLSLMEDGHSGMSFGFTRNILIRLLYEKPLTPIEDVPESWNLVTEDEDGTKMYQCRRMVSLFKDVYPDGTVKYHENNYYCKDINTGMTYSGGGAREILDRYAKPILFPYFPQEKPYVINTAEYLTDRKNGDFDTKAYFSMQTPDGEKIAINEYYGEVDGEWKQITKEEYDVRVKQHFERERLEAKE